MARYADDLNPTGPAWSPPTLEEWRAAQDAPPAPLPKRPTVEHFVALAAPQPDSDWMLEAACRGMDPNIFYPTRGEDNERAITVCRRCPVRDECRHQAETRPEFVGVWGGLSGKQRMLRRRYG